MKLFYCYSYPLKEFLVNENEKYIVTSIHDKTNKKFWVFVGTEKLNSLLDEWRLRRK